MREEEVIVALAAMLCATGTFCYLVHSIKSALINRGKRAYDELAQEIRGLRGEVRQLRQQNNEVILALDSSVPRMDHRLERRETQPGEPLEARIR